MNGLSRRPKAVLIDLAGVLYVGERIIPGAIEALLRLRGSGVAVRFLTNTTRAPRTSIHKLLDELGFAVSVDEIHTAALATRQEVQRRGLRPYYLVHPELVDEMGPSAHDPNVVVLGDAGPYFSFSKLNRAFRVLMRCQKLLAMARNRYFKEAHGLTLDLGAFVAALEFSSGVNAEVIGKPAAAFFLAALAELDVTPAHAVLIGDDLHDDVGGAQRAGIAGILVRTGKYRPADETSAEVRPAYVVNDFAAAVDLILQANHD